MKRVIICFEKNDGKEMTAFQEITAENSVARNINS